MVRTAALVLAVLISHTARAGETLHVTTPSGMVEATFAGSSDADVRGLIGNACLDKGWRVLENQPGKITCSHPDVSSNAALFGPRGSSWWVEATFNLIEFGGSTRVQATDITMSRNALGMITSHSFEPTGPVDVLQTLLTGIGGAYPTGTKITGHDLGFTVKRDEWFLFVDRVEPNSPATNAGLASGDRLDKINGKGFGTIDRFREIANAVPVGQPITLRIRRGKQKLDLRIVPHPTQSP